MRHTRRNKSRINGPARTLTERKRKKKKQLQGKEKKIQWVWRGSQVKFS